MTTFIFFKAFMWEKFCLLEQLSNVKVPWIFIQACIHTNIDSTCACMTFKKAFCGLRTGRGKKECFGREITSMSFSIKPAGKWAAVVEEVKENMQNNYQHEHGCSPCDTSKLGISMFICLWTWTLPGKRKST